MVWHSMQSVSCGDNLYERSNLIFWENWGKKKKDKKNKNKKNNNIWSSAEYVKTVVKMKGSIFLKKIFSYLRKVW